MVVLMLISILGILGLNILLKVISPDFLVWLLEKANLAYVI